MGNGQNMEDVEMVAQMVFLRSEHLSWELNDVREWDKWNPGQEGSK